MKKAIILLCMAAGLLSCARDILDTEKQITQNEGVPMSFNVTVLETKAAKTEWASGDKIYVFFNGLATKYLILSYDGSVWSNASGGGDLLDTDFSGLGTKTITAVHFPIAVDVAYADSKFSFTSGGKPVYTYYLYESGKTYTVDGTTVTATLLMGKPADMVQIHVAGIQANVSDYTFGCSKIRPVACASVGIDGTITESLLQAGARLNGFADADGGIFAGRLTSPDVAANYKFSLASDANIYTLTRASRTLTAGKIYNFPALSETGGSNWTVQNASDLYVDLGITVGGKKIYWAKCNLGATTETGNGDYFAWGEITGYNEGKTIFNWSTYAWGASATTLTKYCDVSENGQDGFTDTLTKLAKEDDAAYAALGGKFRMPTAQEIFALLDLSNEWMTDYKGVSGYKFTGNGNTIFLPSAEGKDNSSPSAVPHLGYYWSSSLCTGRPDTAYSLYFDPGYVFGDDFNRFCGFSVRPVSE